MAERKEVTGSGPRVFFVALGTRGDIQPQIPIIGRLLAAGCAVAVCTLRKLIDFVKNYYAEDQVTYYPLEGDAEFLAKPEFLRALYHGGQMEIAKLLLSEQLGGEMEQNWVREYKAVQDFKADVVVATLSSGETVGFAQKLCVPVVFLGPLPYYPSCEFLPAAIGGGSLPFQWMNSFVNWLGPRMAMSLVGAKLNKYRTETLQLEPIKKIKHGGQPIIGIYSSHFAPPPRDWPSFVHTVGFIPFVPDQYAPPRLLEEFLSEGSKPVYMGFGSMPLERPLTFLKWFTSILTELNLRGIFCAGQEWNKLWAVDQQQIEDNITQQLISQKKEKEIKLHDSITERITPGPSDTVARWNDRVLVIKGCPHEWLFPRCSMAIHHGGAGTTAASIRAGLPTIIYPLFADQPFWAKCVSQLAIGPKDTVMLKNLHYENLRNKILNGSKFEDKSKEMSLKLKDEDGTAEATHLILYYTKELGNCGKYVEWERDEKQVKKCSHSNCNTSFGLFRKRYHCHSCGLIFCSKCLKKQYLPAYPDPEFCCEACISARLTYNEKHKVKGWGEIVTRDQIPDSSLNKLLWMSLTVALTSIAYFYCTKKNMFEGVISRSVIFIRK